MPYGMTGQQPIESYYPGGYGELNLVEQDETLRPFGFTGDFQWVTPRILNRLYNETSPSRPIYEYQWLTHPEYPSRRCNDSIRIRAVYSQYIGFPTISGGNIKYAIIDGVFPKGLTLDIDRGIIFGLIDDLDEIFPEEFGLTNPEGIPESENDVEAFQTFGFTYGDQGIRQFTEDNYARRGSAGLYAAGFPLDKDVTFIARAFDSGNTGRYIDGLFTIATNNNWSSDRDRFILNIRNQMYVDGKPVTNGEYLETMKARGYFPDC